MQFFKNFFSKPLTTTLTVTSNNGFHLRPVAKFVSQAKTYSCDITASFQAKKVSAKAINTLLSLGLDKDDSFTLTFQGKDAPQALEILTQTFLTLMKEDKEVQEVVTIQQNYEGTVHNGTSIYSGIAIAPLHQHHETESYQVNNTTFKEALQDTITSLNNQYENYHPSEQADIYLAQKELLLQLKSQANDIETFSSLVKKEINTLKGTKLESKAVDYQDLLRLIKSNLGYNYVTSYPKTAFILLADDLLPSDIETLKSTQVDGVILQKSSPTSHTAILLRTAGITSCIVPDTLEPTSVDVILDTYAGVLITQPSKQDIESAKNTQDQKSKEHTSQQEKRFLPAYTKEHTHIHIYANVTDVTSAKEAKEAGAEGIGLLRTEFLFGEQKPTLVSQQEAYTEIFALFEDITVRTLDIGGDKALPYIDLPKEDNPFLGVRGVRLFYTHSKILEEQLHAIFLAADGKKVKVMFPMVSTVEEFTYAKSFAIEVTKRHHLNIDNILFGIMIEVPAVLFALKEFDKVVDFYSIGTNDLTQYLFAIERTHPTLKTDALSPVVFSVLEIIIKQTTKPMSICGELASEPKAIEKLLSLGLEKLSMNTKRIAEIKEIVRHL